MNYNLVKIVWDLVLTDYQRTVISKKFDKFKTKIYSQIFEYLTGEIVATQPIEMDNNEQANNEEFFVWNTLKYTL